MEVNDIIQKLSKMEEIENLTPRECCDYQVFLSANLWQAGNNIINTEQSFNKKWNETRATCKSDTQATKVSSLTPEYVAYKQAMYAEKSILETIRSLKKKMRLFESEAQNQL